MGNRLEQPAQGAILSSYKIVPVRLFAEAHVFITRGKVTATTRLACVCVCMLRFSRLERDGGGTKYFILSQRIRRTSIHIYILNN